MGKGSGSPQPTPAATQSDKEHKKALLALALSKKRSNAAVTKDSSSGKANPTVKKQKVSTVPKAESTLRADVLAKFQKFKQSNKQEAIVPKKKVAPKAPVTVRSTSSQPVTVRNTSSQPLTNSTSTPPEGQTKFVGGTDDMTESFIQSQMDILRRKLANGEIDISQVSDLGAEEVVNTTEETAAVEEPDDTKSSVYLDDDSQVLLASQQPSPRPSLGSNESFEETPAFDVDKEDDPFTDQPVDPNLQEESQTSDSEQNNYSVVASYADNTKDEQECPEQEIEFSDGKISIAGIALNLVDLQNDIHSEHCCSVCRQTLLVIVEKLNVILQKLTVLLEQGIQVPSRAPFKPEDYPLMPQFPLTTQLDLVVFNTLLETNQEAVTQFKTLISRVSGKCPPNEIRRILGNIIDDELADVCTWQIARETKNGKPKLVVEDYRVFQHIAEVVIANWEGAKDKNGVAIVVTMTSAESIMQDWIRRSSTRLHNKADKVVLLAEKSQGPTKP